jgi:hypothetical protein
LGFGLVELELNVGPLLLSFLNLFFQIPVLLSDFTQFTIHPVDTHVLLLTHHFILLNRASQPLNFRHHIPQINVIARGLLLPVHQLLPCQFELVVLSQNCRLFVLDLLLHVTRFYSDRVQFSFQLVDCHVLLVDLLFQKLQPCHLSIHLVQLRLAFHQFLTGLIEFLFRTGKLVPHKHQLLLCLSFSGLCLVQFLLDVVVTVLQGLDLERKPGELGLLFVQLFHKVVFDLV